MGDEAALRGLLRQAAALEGEALERFLKGLPAPVRRTVHEQWFWQAHGAQKEPPAEACRAGDWRVWLIQAGRGFGKTRAGAEWVWARARAVPGARVALVGANLDDVVKVMVEGESGLKAAARSGEEAQWVASRMRVDFSTGAQGFAFSGERPEKLRGPEHHFAWCDELAKWARARETWDNLQMTMRLGERPRLIVTTTPRPMRLLKEIAVDARTHVGRGRMSENVHLPDDFRAAVAGLYGGTRIGRQELDGELIEDVEGALWPRELIERCRVPSIPPAPLHHATHGPLPQRRLGRIVIGVDPPAGVDGDACGIVVAGRGEDDVGPSTSLGTGYVLDDASVAGLSPEGWARAVARAAEKWRADRVVAEANQGGRMVESVLRGVEPDLPLKLVHASEGTAARAEPVAALFERGRAKLAGRFPELEDELAGLQINGGYQGPGKSPDRADACVWALTELMLGKQAAEPRVRPLF